MSRYALIFVLTFLPRIAFSQKEDFIWRVGYWSIIDFNSGQADTLSSNAPPILMDFANTSICDSLGELLFFSNGVALFNASNDTLFNGAGLNPSAFTSNYNAIPITQANILIRRPANPNFYYLFHETIEDNTALLTNILYMTVIDKSLDSGRGGVTATKNYHLYDNDTIMSGKLSAIKHANGTDWWLLTRKKDHPIFLSWLISADTISGPFVQSNLQGVGVMFDPSLGQVCFSPDGSKYAAMYSNKYFYLYDFDRCSGELTNLYSSLMNDSSAWGNGCAFSQSGRYLYVATNFFIYQYDMLAGNIGASKTTVATYDGFLSPSETRFNQMRLGPDGKIYVSTDNGCDVMHVIEFPDSAGIACNVIQHSFYFSQSNANVVSVPNIPDYKLGAKDPPCDSTNVIPELSNSNFKLQAYPNPTKGTLTLKFGCRGETKYSLFVMDISGRSLVNSDGSAFKGINLKEMDLSHLAKGIYFVNLKSSEINETIRITIE